MSLHHNDLKIVTQVIAKLKNGYREGYTHSCLAGEFCTNERKLRAIFKMVTGKTINDFLTEIRIEKVKEYLASTDDPVKMIARNVGLEIRTLEKHFKRSTGKTPLAWRREEIMLVYDRKTSASKRK